MTAGGGITARDQIGNAIVFFSPLLRQSSRLVSGNIGPAAGDEHESQHGRDDGMTLRWWCHP